MVNLVETILYVIDDKHLLEMANVQPRDSGLKSIVHVSYKGGAKHGARVKVSNVAGTFHPSDNFTVTLEAEPRVVGNCKLKKEHLDDIKDWVKLNRDHINHVWHHGDTMSGTEIDNGLKSL